MIIQFLLILFSTDKTKKEVSMLELITLDRSLNVMELHSLLMALVHEMSFPNMSKICLLV